MANTYSQIYLHVVFAVSGRGCVIRPNRKEELQKYITGIVTRRKQKLIAINCMPRSHTYSYRIEARRGTVGSDWTDKNQHNQPYQRTAMDWLPFFVAGRIWRIFRFAFTLKYGDQLHSEPGESPSAQAISPRVCGIPEAS
jgi:hypothetical protein